MGQGDVNCVNRKRAAGPVFWVATEINLMSERSHSEPDKHSQISKNPHNKSNLPVDL